MKNIFIFTAIIATFVALTGCTTVSIDKPNSDGKLVGLWNSRTLQDIKFYKSDIEAVSTAARKALNEKKCKVVYETAGAGRARHNEIVARGDMDVKITVDVYARTEQLPKNSKKIPEKYVEVSIVYDTWGDLPHSQDIVARMLKYLPPES